MSTFYYVPQYFTTQLSVAGGIDDTQTTGIVLQSISGVDETKPGIIAVTWSNPIDTTKVEYITYTSINATTKELQGVTRGEEGYSAKSHVNGATVAWPLSKSHINNINDSLLAYDGGWRDAGETWTRESDNSFSEPIDATLKYQKGDKIRYKQGGTYKYQYIIRVGAYSGGKTIIITTGGSDFVFTSGTAITDNYYSHNENPLGFPGQFNCAQNWVVSTIDDGSGGQPTVGSCYFDIKNNTVNLFQSTGTAYKAGTNKTINFNIPATLPNMTAATYELLGICYVGSVDAFGSVSPTSATTCRGLALDSVNDNTLITKTSIKISYKF